MADTDLITAAPTTTSLSKMMPQSLVELGQLAAKVAASGMFTVRKKVGGQYKDVPYTQSEAFLLMSQGVELGLSPLQGIRELNIIEGRVDVPPAVRAARICASSKVTLWDVDADDTHCVIAAKRSDRENGCQVEVKAADMPAGDVARHKDHLEDWLYARAVRRISRRYFPDLNLGIEQGGWEPDESRIIDVREVERIVGEDTAPEYPPCEHCGGTVDLIPNHTGGAFLACRECKRTTSPPQGVRDVIRGSGDTLSVATVEETRDVEGPTMRDGDKVTVTHKVTQPLDVTIASNAEATAAADALDAELAAGEVPPTPEEAAELQSYAERFTAGLIAAIVEALAQARAEGDDARTKAKAVLFGRGWDGVTPIAEWLRGVKDSRVTDIATALGCKIPSIS